MREINGCIGIYDACGLLFCLIDAGFAESKQGEIDENPYVSHLFVEEKRIGYQYIMKKYQSVKLIFFLPQRNFQRIRNWKFEVGGRESLKKSNYV